MRRYVLTSIFIGAFLAMGTGCDDSDGPGLNDQDILAGESDVNSPVDGQETADTAGSADRGSVPDGGDCVPGETMCQMTNFLVCSDDGKWEIDEICPSGTSCTVDGCQTNVCQPNTPECNEDGQMVLCLPDGSGFSAPIACPEGHTCIGGQCLTTACNEGDKECTQTCLLICEGDPAAWTEVPCDEGEICFNDECVDCFTDTQCPDNMTCQEGHCAPIPLAIETEELPDGQINTAYLTALSATGGTTPYAWSTVGALPAGLAINATTGEISGTPTVDDTFNVTVMVQDTDGLGVQKEFSLLIHEEGLTITSKSPLTNAEEGTEYSYQFTALGGTMPYGWMVTTGALPAGLSVSSSGLLSGTPTEHGSFTFSMRAVDTGDPIDYDTKEFSLTVEIAPLEIIGDQIVDLFLTKAVILGMITIIEGIPIPYSAQLQAKGGVKPYSWTETELPALLTTFIPEYGVPTGLTLSSNGTLSGSVTNTDQVFELNVPFVNLTLTGFFFMATVTDSQDPADSDQAIFLIPTIPIAL